MTGTFNGLTATPNRVRRLEQVARGEVWAQADTWWHQPTDTVVTSAVDKMLLAEWVEPCQEDGRLSCQPIKTGWQVLDAHNIREVVRNGRLFLNGTEVYSCCLEDAGTLHGDCGNQRRSQ